MNDFKFELGKIRHGWASIDLFNGDEKMIGMSGTGVYNPFYDFPKIFKSIMEDLEYSWIVDQEGYDGSVKFIPKGETITIETEELKKYPKYEKMCVVFEKKQVMAELYRKIIEWEEENREEMADIFYDFWFNIREVVALYEKGHYDHEVVRETIYKYKNETIVSEYDTEEEKIEYVLDNKERSGSLGGLLRKTILYSEMSNLECIKDMTEKNDHFIEQLKQKNIEILKPYCKDELFYSFF